MNRPWGPEDPPPTTLPGAPEVDDAELTDTLARELDRAAVEAAGSPAEPPLALPEVDLSTLLAEMVALKAEVRAETRASRDARTGVNEQLQALGRRLRRLAETTPAPRAQEEARRETALALIDVADRLDPAVRAARAKVRRRWLGLWWREDAVMKGLIDGLDLTLQRISGHLKRLGVQRMTALGAPFDPGTMEAVQVVDRPGAAPGTVVEEMVAGYRTEQAVLRTAQVVVQRHPLALDHEGEGAGVPGSEDGERGGSPAVSPENHTSRG